MDHKSSANTPKVRVGTPADPARHTTVVGHSGDKPSNSSFHEFVLKYAGPRSNGENCDPTDAPGECERNVDEPDDSLSPGADFR